MYTVILFTAACLIQLGLGLQCYTCSSLYDENCVEPDKSKTRIDTCPPNGDHLNYCSTLKFEFENKTVTERRCEPYDDCKKMLVAMKVLYPINSFTSCETCSSDLCNSASNVQVTAALGLAVLMSVFYTFF